MKVIPMMMPIFLKRAANPAALDWTYAYKVDWNQPMMYPASGILEA